LKKDAAEKATVDAAILSMCTLNRASMESALPWEVHAATDVTGFGLLGHAREMALGSKVSFAIDSAKIEFLPEARELAQKGFLPGGLKRNQEFIGGCVEFTPGVPEEVRNLLFDPQTSGGLLLSVASKDATRLLESLHANGVNAQQVGEVIERTHPLLQVR
jgi:selenide,water dikinase